jgi:hypothetical protein
MNFKDGIKGNRSKYKKGEENKAIGKEINEEDGQNGKKQPIYKQTTNSMV